MYGGSCGGVVLQLGLRRLECHSVIETEADCGGDADSGRGVKGGGIRLEEEADLSTSLPEERDEKFESENWCSASFCQAWGTSME